ncbi:MAG: aminodeoxychorismate/anthranilate synthase component II [candidate division NC10 bacterium]|nr:aminodeoxychorismate/anthranilate synthase component II [candidate division NC10 bacterium]
MLLMIDNYDSFTYNLVQYLRELGAEVAVYRNDRIDLKTIRALAPERIVLSPGPCTPAEAGICCDLIRAAGATTPLLGVCLGHQCIGAAYGGRIVRAARLMHGKTSPIQHDGRGVFQGLPNPFEATRYHSLLIERSSLPGCLDISAATAEGEIMGVRHRTHPVEGVQFHPESILTQAGKGLLRNFLQTPVQERGIACGGG